MTNFLCFQSAQFANANFKFDENGRKFSKLVGNTEGKGKIACHHSGDKEVISLKPTN